MGDLKSKLKKLEEKLNLNQKINQKDLFKIIFKIKGYEYGFNEISDYNEKITAEEWQFYVEYTKRLAKQKNEELSKIEKEIENLRLEIEKQGGFKN